ncbi:MAG: hypothetical protein JWO78_1246 [Micavibrio sp.]|nr:hypothetical protein [Micavibrio sp.]
MKILSLLCALTLLSVPAAHAADTAHPAIVVSDAYAFAVPDGAKAGAVFMRLTYPNNSEIVPDRILHAATPAAGKAEIHTMTLDDNVMSMRKVDSFPLPPTGTFSLKPDGVHVMLLDLKRSLKVGDQFPLTLTFAKAGAVKVDVNVRAPGDVPDNNAEPPEERAVHEDMKMDPAMNHDAH